MQEGKDAAVLAIQKKLEKVNADIAAAATRAGRAEDSVRLVVVTKSQPLHVVQAAISAGATILGENYPDEAAQKIDALKELPVVAASGSGAAHVAAGGPSSVEWHMIGHVQSRKARMVVPNFTLIHSLDSVKLAERLDRLAGETGKQLRALLEFNVGGEVAKYGWNAADESAWPALLPDVEAILHLQNITVQGLMTMPPLSSNPQESRPHFRMLRQLRDFLAVRAPQSEWSELSMGTSADFAVAVEEGATLVRVGEAILGRRPSREGE